MRLFVAAALGLASSVLPAAADSRDLVLDRMSRCYALTDTRQYLKCLYGASQPLRNELGLAPAPQAATFAGLFARPAPQAAYMPSAAPVAAPPARPASVPQQTSNDRGMFSGLIAGAVGMKTTMVPPEQFGLRNARPGRGSNVDHITARMAQYSLDKAGGHFTVTLDNGQVWRQQNGDEHNPIWNKSASTYVATISYGAGGSYNLTVAGEREPYKVTRLR
jgi:hypothetical protein